MKEIKKISKREASARGYINEQFEQSSKLNVIRVDLSYKKPYSDDISLEDAEKDLDKMFNNMRSKPTIWKDKVGHIIKKEFTEDKGMHLHALFLFDGQKIKSDVFKAEQIGTYWSTEITAGKGSYHNCNRNKYEENGIGMIDYKDKDKRKILDEIVIPYLCKDEQDIADAKGITKSKSFHRGTMSRKKVTKMGRPREEL